nr:tyrosine-type recombinase/integrase [Lachnospiraceae bacterium]
SADILNANFHTTRHTYATRCIEQEVDIKCLSEMLGHSSVSITLNRYVHPSMAMKTKNMAKLTSIFPIKISEMK